NPTFRTPVVTIGLITLNAVVWFLVEGAGSAPALYQATCSFALFPAEVTGRALGEVVAVGPDAACVLANTPHYSGLVTSMFLHGGWLPLIGNMWFLWIFGNNVEDSMGRWRFAAFYLLCGLAAAGAQVLADPQSRLPMLGASGAIGGVM